MSDANRWKGGRGPYIRMKSGKQFFLNDPQPEDLDFSDVAYHLARINRYTGASEFSVGQHTIVAARMAERFYPDHALLPARMLIHDIGEHAYGDVSSPLKSLLPDYKVLEQKVELAIEARCDLTFIGDKLVKEVDDRMWLTERLLVYPQLSKTDDYHGPLEPFPLTRNELEEDFAPWWAGDTTDEWLTEFRRLLPWVQL